MDLVPGISLSPAATRNIIILSLDLSDNHVHVELLAAVHLRHYRGSRGLGLRVDDFL